MNNPAANPPVPDANDLILVADTGQIFLIKMSPVAGGNIPTSISELPASTAEVPAMLRDANATLAILPDEPGGGGATCTLLNMISIKPALRPVMTKSQKSVLDAQRAIDKGHTVAIVDPGGKTVQNLAFGQTPADAK